MSKKYDEGERKRKNDEQRNRKWGQKKIFTWRMKPNKFGKKNYVYCVVLTLGFFWRVVSSNINFFWKIESWRWQIHQRVFFLCCCVKRGFIFVAILFFFCMCVSVWELTGEIQTAFRLYLTKKMKQNNCSSYDDFAQPSTFSLCKPDRAKGKGVHPERGPIFFLFHNVQSRQRAHPKVQRQIGPGYAHFRLQTLRVALFS